MDRRPIGRTVLVALALCLSAGCGVHYWQRQGANVQDFERDSNGWVTEAKVPRLNFEPEQLYRACMRARGWQRVQVGVPDAHQFRGPEDVKEFDKPPSPTAGQATTPSNAAAEIGCRQPRASRPAGLVCPPR